MASARVLFIDDAGIVTIENFVGISSVSEITMLRTATKTLTHSQIRTLPTAPVEIVPSPGAGKALFIIGGRFGANCVGGAYTGFTGYSAIELAVSSADLTFTGQTQNTILPSALIGDSGYQVQQSAPYYLIGSGAYDGELTQGAQANSNNPPDENLPIVCFGFNGVQVNFTGGNANNTLKVTVFYTTVDV